MIPDNIPVTKLLTNFADGIAVSFIQLQKKVYQMKKVSEDLLEKRRIARRQKLLEDYHKKIQERKEKERKANQNGQQSGDPSRLARINRIKEAMYNRQGQEQYSNVRQVDQSIIYEHFSSELRPQILAKYPNAPMEKVNKVIQQKWNTIDAAKKETYTQKIIRKLQLQPPQPINRDSQQNRQIAVKKQPEQQVVRENTVSDLGKYVESKIHREEHDKEENKIQNQAEQEQIHPQQKPQEQQEEPQVKKQHEIQTEQPPQIQNPNVGEDD